MGSLHKTIIFVGAVTFLSLTVFPVFAQVQTIGNGVSCGFFTCSGDETFLNIKVYIATAMDAVYLLLPTLAVVYLIVAAAMYITSTGDEEKANRAKRQIIYALGGLAMAFISSLIVGYAQGTTSAPMLLLFIGRYMNRALALFGALATAYLIYAGFKYITSQGDEDASATAKRQIAYAVIGLLISGGALYLVNVTGLLQVNINAIANVADTQLTTAINMALLFVGTVATIFLIYAGFKYITSQGDEDASATAKRQIAYALIGIFIAGTASIIKTAVMTVNATTLLVEVRKVANAVLTVLSVAAVLYVILGGVMYMASQGDEDQAERAKMQVLYAILGVIVIALSAVLVNFIIGAI